MSFHTLPYSKPSGFQQNSAICHDTKYDWSLDKEMIEELIQLNLPGLPTLQEPSQAQPSQANVSLPLSPTSYCSPCYCIPDNCLAPYLVRSHTLPPPRLHHASWTAIKDISGHLEGPHIVQIADRLELIIEPWLAPPPPPAAPKHTHSHTYQHTQRL